MIHVRVVAGIKLVSGICVVWSIVCRSRVCCVQAFTFSIGRSDARARAYTGAMALIAVLEFFNTVICDCLVLLRACIVAGGFVESGVDVPADGFASSL